MKKKEIMFDSISFEDVKKVITEQDIYKLINGNPDYKYSMQLKKFLFLITGLFIPIVMFVTYVQGHKNMPETVYSRSFVIVISLIFIGLLLYFYFFEKSNFEYVRYKNFVYTSAKIVYFSYICGSLGRVDENYITNVLTTSIFIPTCLMFYYYIEQNRVIENFNTLFNKSYKTSKILAIFLKLFGLVMALVVLSVQLYRPNKWWIKGIRFNGEIKGTGFVIVVIVGILVMLLIALIPTYLCFDAQLSIKNQLISKYSEEFRKEYHFTKKEWYGE